jgi:hypothetical protein
MLSMTSQANSIGQVAGGPALGWRARAVSIQAALLGSALVLSPTITLYRRFSARVRDAALTSGQADRPRAKLPVTQAEGNDLA